MAQETLAAATSETVIPSRHRGQFSLVTRALLRRKLATLSLIYIAIFYFCGIFAPLIAPGNYREQNLDQALRSPSLDHPFGTDRLGRDMLTRVIYAARTTAIITVITVISGSLIIGPALGLLAGYRRGVVDIVINRLGEVVAGLPELLIIIFFAAKISPRLNEWNAKYYDAPVIGDSLRGGFGSLAVVAIVLTLFGWVASMRFIRSLTLQVRESEYVLAARSMGAGTWRVIFQHILPNISYVLVLGAATAFGAIALAEIGLTFLGLGVRPPVPSFGEMINAGAPVRTLEAHPHLLFIPAFFAVMLLLSWSLLGDALNDVLNPKTRDL
jgi:ABC-type dipeptide/oligopeptide/nickel transport system permease subunit